MPAAAKLEKTEAPSRSVAPSSLVGTDPVPSLAVTRLGRVQHRLSLPLIHKASRETGASESAMAYQKLGRRRRRRNWCNLANKEVSTSL